jgi:hypothetical protein
MPEHVKAELDCIDAEALQAISEIINQAKRKAAVLPRPAAGSTSTGANKAMTGHSSAQFVGENWTLEEFERLSPEERAMRKWRLKEKNRAWLQEKFSTLNAAWVVVVDRKVVASGERLENKPVSSQLIKIHHLKPKVLLDFEKRQTEIGTSVKPEPTRKKSAIRKKRTPRRR